VFAFLRPRGHGSTWMIGDDDLNFVGKYESTTSPLEVMNKVINWAEQRIEVEEKDHNSKYPWRKDKSKETIK
jgi:hypothetical protein